jgi:hypothetical protein
MVQERGIIPKPLTEQELKKLVVDAINATTYAETLETFHALYGHMDRGIESDDVIHGLEGEWQFERQPQFNEEHWQWKYYIATETVDGDSITVVVAVDSWRREFKTITRWRQN